MRRRMHNLPHQLTITRMLCPLAFPILLTFSRHHFHPPPKSPSVNPNPGSSVLLSLVVRHGHTALLTSANLGDDGDLALLRDLFLTVSSQAWLARTSRASISMRRRTDYLTPQITAKYTLCPLALPILLKCSCHQHSPYPQKPPPSQPWPQ